MIIEHRPPSSARVAAALVAAALVAAACSSGGGSDPTTTTTQAAASTSEPCTPVGSLVALPDEPFRGFTLSPIDYDSESVLVFFENAAINGEAVARVGRIDEWGDPESGLAVVDGLAGQYGYVPISTAGVFNLDTGELFEPLDDAAIERYVAAARDYVECHEPPYLGLGVEVDTQWRLRPDDFDRFVELFAAVADAVHEASPDTKVFTTFQLERLSGMQGGLFNGTNDPRLSNWELIDRFPDADLIAFTTYPGLVYADPADLPDDYYSRLTGYTGGRPIAFTEMGWQADGEYAQYSGTEEKQAAFIERLPDLFADTDLAFYIWSFLYDQQVTGPFGFMGLVDRGETPRLGWWVWQEQNQG